MEVPFCCCKKIFDANTAINDNLITKNFPHGALIVLENMPSRDRDRDSCIFSTTNDYFGTTAYTQSNYSCDIYVFEMLHTHLVKSNNSCDIYVFEMLHTHLQATKTCSKWYLG